MVDGAKAFKARICNIPKGVWSNSKEAILQNLVKADVCLQRTMTYYHEGQADQRKEALKIHTAALKNIKTSRDKKIEKLECKQESKMHMVNAFRTLQRKQIMTKEDILNNKNFNKEQNDIRLNTRALVQKYHSGRAGKIEEQIAMEEMKANNCNSKIDNITLNVTISDKNLF